MIATIELYECLTDRLKKTDRRGRVISLFYVVKIESFIKYYTDERAAWRFLKKMGFELSDNNANEWELKKKSDEQIFLERHYKKV